MYDLRHTSSTKTCQDLTSWIYTENKTITTAPPNRQPCSTFIWFASSLGNHPFILIFIDKEWHWPEGKRSQSRWCRNILLSTNYSWGGTVLGTISSFSEIKILQQKTKISVLPTLWALKSEQDPKLIDRETISLSYLLAVGIDRKLDGQHRHCKDWISRRCKDIHGRCVQRPFATVTKPMSHSIVKDLSKLNFKFHHSSWLSVACFWQVLFISKSGWEWW